MRMTTRVGIALTGALLLAAVTGGALTSRADSPPLGQGYGAALGAEETALLKTLDIGHAMRQMGAISARGERVVGTKEEARAQKYVYDTLKAMPLDRVVTEEFATTSWSHESDAVRIVSPDGGPLPASIYGNGYGIWGMWHGTPYSFGNANAGKTLRARVVDAGYGTAADFDALGALEGAIALVRRDDNLQAWPNTMTEEAARHGASAIINYGYYGGIVHPDGIKQDVSGGPIPEYAISVNSAARLKTLLQAGPVVLELEGRADEVTEQVGRSVNVAAYLYGSTRPHEYIIFSGHIDSWWDGTNDDASSIAAVLEFARMFSEARAAGHFINERTLVFLSVGGEEFGGPSETWYDWLIGSYEFVRAHPDIMRGLVVELNMDGVSFRKTSGKYWIESTWEINGFLDAANRALGGTGQVAFYNPIYSWTDAWSFAAKAGGSAVQSLWEVPFDSYYHTQLDNMDRADAEPLTIVLKLYSLAAMRADRAIVLPFDFTSTVDWAAAALASEQFAVPYLAGPFARAEAALAGLRNKAAATNAQAAALRQEYAAAVTDAARAAVRTRADALNRRMIDARRIITPWTLGEGGTMGSWDVFLRSDQHVNDLAAIDAALTALRQGRGQIHTALGALERVYSMEWGRLYSPATYETVMGWMINDSMYWGAEFDQQQAYVNVHGIYTGLRSGALGIPDATAALEVIRTGQLIPWLVDDLETLERAWTEAAGTL